MQGNEVEDQTEEGGDLTSQEEVVEGEAEVEVGKEELVAGMTVTISALILDPHVPAGIDLSHLCAVFQYPCPTLSLCFAFFLVLSPDLAKDKVAAVQVVGMEVEEGEEAEIGKGMEEVIGKA